MPTRALGGATRRARPERSRTGAQDDSHRADRFAAALEEVRDDRVHLALWRRELPAGLEPHLTAWAAQHPARLDTIISTSRYDFSAATGGIAAPYQAWLMTDMTLRLARFALFAGAARLKVSLGAVRTDQCRKFHVDYVRYRLVTTYAGPGTEWVPDEAVRREVLEHPPDCPCDANKEIVRDASAIRRAVAGDVLVMKGARHESGRGAVHRSPPIEATGQVRVVLVASTVDEG